MPPSVLLVVDDVGMVETLADILSHGRSYDVATAHTGEAALAKCRERRYDVVLMDIVMPGINGVEALKRLKADDPALSVIMMTAYSRNELVQEARQIATAVLTKPLDLELVLQLIDGAAGAAG